MAAEYKLKFTAEEIDNKLSKIEFDEMPTEGSKNLVTSGAVHTALQSAGGGTDLVAGDFIEIKDGVVRCTFGDVIGTIDTFNELLRIDNLELEGEDGEYYWEDYADNVPEIGETVSIYLTLPGEDTPIHYNAETIDVEGDGYSCYAFCNTDMENFGSAIDPSLPAFAMFFANYEEDGEEIKYAGVAAFGDYTGATLVVGTGGVETQYVLLPDTALGLGREIVTEVNEEIVNVESIEMEEDGVFMAIITPPKLPENGTILEVAFAPLGETEPINFTAEVTELIIDGEFISWIASCNATFSFEDGSITAIDENLPAFVIQMVYDDGDLDYPIMVIVSATDYTGASIVINNKVIKKTHVKLPNEALNFDVEPTKGSTNLVNSGALYTAIENIASVPNFDFDSVPTENSENLINSGSVYNAINSIDIEPQLVEGFYIFNGVVERNPNLISLSANRRAIPVAQHAWVEGRAAERQVYINCALGRPNQYSGANVIFYYGFESEGEAQWEINAINNEYGYMFITFEDEPDRQYLIRCREAYKTENRAGLCFYFDQIKGHEFPVVTTYPDTRNIKEVICLPKVGDSSHSEGHGLAMGTASHAEGGSRASGGYSHAEGFNTIASRERSHAEGDSTIANGANSHTEGDSTIANGANSHVQGKYNIEDNLNKYAHIVGNGTNDDNRSNAHTLDWDGNAWFAGNIYVGDNKRVLTEGMKADITMRSITTDMINISAPGDDIISEIVTRTFDNAHNGRVLGQNILALGQWYLVTYDGFEYILTPDTNGYSYYMGDDNKYGFEITQTINDSIKATNITTPDNDEHTITISQLETSRVNLMDYILALEERIAQLEAKLNS